MLVSPRVAPGRSGAVCVLSAALGPLAPCELLARTWVMVEGRE